MNTRRHPDSFLKSRRTQRFIVPASIEECRERLLYLRETHEGEAMVFLYDLDEGGLLEAHIKLLLLNSAPLAEVDLIFELQSENVTLVHGQVKNNLFIWSVPVPFFYAFAVSAVCALLTNNCLSKFVFLLLAVIIAGFLLITLMDWINKQRHIRAWILHILMTEPIHLNDGDVY